MAIERRVTHTKKDSDGDIIALCNTGEQWSPCVKYESIRQIECGLYIYYVEDKKGRSDIEVVKDPNGKHLQTKKDGRASNNLDNLPHY